MIQISDCPITGLQRKLTYDFYWLTTIKQIIVNCHISHYQDDELINNARINNYDRQLVASDSLVNPVNGHIYTQQELDVEPKPDTISEYDYYVTVLGITHLILPQLIESIILARDAEGKFNI